MSKMMTYGEAIREAMSIRMRENPNVILFGEDVGAFGGCFFCSSTDHLCFANFFGHFIVNCSNIRVNGILLKTPV